MPGFYSYDEQVEKTDGKWLRDIRLPKKAAKKTDRGWVAGPIAVKNGHADHEGQIVSEDYANRARRNLKNENLVKTIMRYNDLNEDNAREHANKMQRKIDQADSDREVGEIRQQYIKS